MTIAIWGSCVTRDTFEIGGSWDAPLSYHARSSWISQASRPSTPPVAIPEGAGFGQRMVREDLAKTILHEAVATQPAVMIFDLIDERFDLLRVGPSWYSANDYYPRLELEDDLRAASERTVAFRDADRDELFPQAVRELAQQWMDALPDTQFVLHRAWYTARSADPDNHPFYASAPQAVRWCNERLARHYAALHEAFGTRLLVVEPDPDRHLVADPGHKWGLAHFHYVPGYYESCLEQIRRIAEGSVPGPRPVRMPTPEQSGAAPSEGSGPAEAVAGAAGTVARMLPSRLRAALGRLRRR